MYQLENLEQIVKDSKSQNTKLKNRIQGFFKTNRDFQNFIDKIQKVSYKVHPIMLCIMCKEHRREIYQEKCGHCYLCWRCFLSQWGNHYFNCMNPDCHKKIKMTRRLLYKKKASSTKKNLTNPYRKSYSLTSIMTPYQQYLKNEINLK